MRHFLLALVLILTPTLAYPETRDIGDSQKEIQAGKTILFRTARATMDDSDDADECVKFYDNGASLKCGVPYTGPETVVILPFAARVDALVISPVNIKENAYQCKLWLRVDGVAQTTNYVTLIDVGGASDDTAHYFRFPSPVTVPLGEQLSIMYGNGATSCEDTGSAQGPMFYIWGIGEWIR
jgi:hypothetical protein